MRRSDICTTVYGSWGYWLTGSEAWVTSPAGKHAHSALPFIVY